MIFEQNVSGLSTPILLNVDREAMGRIHEKFVQYKREGQLLSPDTVGNAIAGLAICKNDKLREFSGRFVNWNDDIIMEFYKENS